MPVTSSADKAGGGVPRELSAVLTIAGSAPARPPDFFKFRAAMKKAIRNDISYLGFRIRQMGFRQ